MEKQYKLLKLWQGLLAIILTAVILFGIAPRMSGLGLLGSVIGEWMLVVISILILLAGKVNIREVLPFKKPRIMNSIGVVFMWVGVLLLEMAVILLSSVLFPEQYSEMSAGISLQFIGTPLLVVFLVLAVTPAICEEVVFRGVFLHSLKPEQNKWLAVIISGVVFGAFHQDFLRIIPLSFAGIMMGYILVETGNMFYNCLFHFVNNTLSVFGIYILGKMTEALDGQIALEEMTELGMADMTMMLPVVGIYVMMAAAAPACIYIGNYLLHNKVPGYRKKLFPSGKPGIVFFLVISSAVLFLIGVFVMLYGFIRIPEYLNTAF